MSTHHLRDGRHSTFKETRRAIQRTRERQFVIESEVSMLDIFVRINKVDRNVCIGREHPPTPDMEGSYVRVLVMEEVPGLDEMWKYDAATPYQLFTGILVDANGDDVEGGEVELVDSEIDAYCNMPQLFGCKKERNA